MPTYEYECAACGQFEAVQKISEPAYTSCPKCNGTSIKRLVSGAAFHLKGSGWYKTDYASSSSGSSSSSSASSTSTTSDSSKPEAKTETKADTCKPGGCGSCS